VQQCVAISTSGHSYTNVSNGVVEAQGCPGLMDKAGERWPVRQKPLEQESPGGYATKEEASGGGSGR
jgi:hypothetical protein